METPNWITGLAGGLFLAFMVGLAGFLVWIFRRHDPARARYVTTTGADGTFALDLPSVRAGEALCFRFLIDGVDTESAYRLAVRAELVAAGVVVASVERHTEDGIQPLGPGPIDTVGAVYAVTTSEGSIHLLTVPRDGAFTVRGRVRAEAPTVLERGWIYIRS